VFANGRVYSVAIKLEEAVMPNYSLVQIEGIGAANSRKMKMAKVGTTSSLLKKGATPKGRKELAKSSGVSESVILKWVNMADLFRVKGIGKQYSELLEKAGVDTVKELRNRLPDNLAASLEKANSGPRRLVRQLPGVKRCRSWINAAKKLPPAVTY
jgi:predicted flap endonuclease-1-like 5' DNA nuclease